MFPHLWFGRARRRLAGSFAALGASALAVAATPPGASESPLHRALNRGEPQWTSLVAAPALDLDARDAHGNTPLHLAALRGNADAVDALLARGANPNAANPRGATPLHYGSGSERIVRALLARGAKVDAVSDDGMTPLMSAVMRGRSHAVALVLVDAGADVNALRKDDKTGTLALAILGGDRQTIRLLLDRGAKPDAGGESTPLTMATFTGNLDLVRTLLDRGADVNTPDPFLGHALNFAFYSGHAEIAALLIERGANLTTPSGFGGGTPPMVWSAYNEHGDTTLARLLVSHGVDPNASNAAGETALSYALKRGPDTPLARYLRSIGGKAPGAVREKLVPVTEVLPVGAGRDAQVRDSAQRAIELLQRSSTAFLETGIVRDRQKCVSCHHQNLPAVAYGLAQERGLQVDEHAVGRQLHAQIAAWSRRAEAARQMRDPTPNPPVVLGYGLAGLAASRYAADDVTDAIGHYLLGAQQADGSWFSFDIRPPMEAGPLLATAWAVRSLTEFAPPGEARAAAAAVQQARDWLALQEPRTHNEMVFQLFGLAWSGDSLSQLQPYIDRLLALQRPDGGWASLAGREADAYATGSTLAAFHAAGMSVSRRGYQRGVEYLLRTQFDDGSWWVRSRTWPFQPHFDSQFPHGKDQWISAGGTAWACIALLLTLEPSIPAERFANGQTLIAKFTATRGAASPAAATPPAAAVARRVSFRRDIEPIVERSCVGCHKGEKPKGGFTFATRDSLLKGGQSGDPAIVPGRSSESHLLRYISDAVEDLEMPPLGRREKYPALSATEIALVRDWIDGGAVWD